MVVRQINLTSIGFGVLITAIACGGPARAGTSAAPVQNQSYFELYQTQNNVSGAPSDTGTLTDRNIDYASPYNLYSGITLTGLSQLDTDVILFKNGVLMSGGDSYGTMVTGVAITFTNTNATRVVRPVVTSTLLAAGVGLYASEQFRLSYFNAQPPTVCSTRALGNCGAITDNRSNSSPSFFGNSYASFDFDVSVNGASIYALNGKVATNAYGDYYQELDAAAATLNGFRKVTDDGSPWALGYAWDDTNVRIALPNPLDPGESVTALYTITTTVKLARSSSFTYDQTHGLYDLAVGQIGYSSFGDPTGGKAPISTSATAALTGAGITNLGTSGPVVDLSKIGMFQLSGGTRVIDPQTGAAALVSDTREVFNRMTGEYELIAPLGGTTTGSFTQPVPEPANWAMLIAGFGLTGATMRRRRATLA